MNDKKFTRKFYKKYLYYRFLMEIKEYHKKGTLKPGKPISIHIDLDFVFSEKIIKFLEEEITHPYPGHH